MPTCSSQSDIVPRGLPREAFTLSPRRVVPERAVQPPNKYSKICLALLAAMTSLICRAGSEVDRGPHRLVSSRHASFHPVDAPLSTLARTAHRINLTRHRGAPRAGAPLVTSGAPVSAASPPQPRQYLPVPSPLFAGDIARAR